MIVYRIAQARYINDLSGKGAYLYGARWTRKGTYAIYTAENLSLAYLEYVVHQYEREFWPTDLMVASIDIEESKIRKILPSDLPRVWQEIRYSFECQNFVSDLFNEDVLGVVIPSVVVPHEHNVVLNPLFSRFSTYTKIKAIELLTLDERLKPRDPTS